MTCIVGLEVDGVAYIGGDSAFSDTTGNGTTLLEESKVFHNGDLTFGFCGSLRLGQILSITKFPKRLVSETPEKYVQDRVIPAFRSTMVKNGLVKEDGEIPDGSITIMAVGGKCFYIQEDFAWARFRSNEYAEGSGGQFALGSLHTTRSMALTPVERVTMALAAASELCTSVAPPFTVLSNV